MFVFVSITSNSFDLKSNDDFCLLKHEFRKRRVQQWKLPYEFLRILSIFQGTFYCLILATVAVDINARTLKENGIRLSQFTESVIEARFLRNIRLRLFTTILISNKVYRNLAILLYDCPSIYNICRTKNRTLFWSVGQDHRRFEVILILIYFIKRTKLH